MQRLTSTEIADTFLQFFINKDHRKIAGSTLIPEHDPTLLFINSGMAPLKDYFLGVTPPPHKRLCNVQPCLRTTDIEDVGDRHHLTYFEMLGSWSIGDYYKEKAIELAYELLVDVFKFDPARLYVTVFKGDASANLPADEQSAKVWEKIGIPRSRIVPLGTADNFWGPAGEFGPCGSCTEVFYDCGAEFGDAYKTGGEFNTTSRYIEIWNAGVFIELNKKSDGTVESLPLKSVDTGSGLERMAMIMNGCADIYQTDTLRPIWEECQKHYSDPHTLRLLTDHLRATTLVLAEGVSLSNIGRGYIPRRLLRKCIALALCAKEDCAEIPHIVQTVVQTMRPRYPELAQASDFIHSQCQKEIAEFQPVVSAGLRLLTQKLGKLKSNDVPANLVFELVATHGLPLEIIKNYLANNDFRFNMHDYEREWEKHRAVSRAEQKSRKTDTLLKLLQDVPDTEFLGYHTTETTTPLRKLIVDGEEVDKITRLGTEFFFIVNTTPFYAESGGQVADTGKATTPTGEITVHDVQKKNAVFVHRAQLVAGEVERGTELHLTVDAARRLLIRRNHSVTHLLQSALRATLGTHISQRGSYVDEHKFRFDFQNDRPVTFAERHAVELLVNSWIWQSIPRVAETLPYEQAIKKGALFMLGENYRDEVRTISFGDASIELCGGTHVENTAEIGLMRITGETSIAKGIRRIEGITGVKALQAQQQQSLLLQQACELLTVGTDNLLERIKKLKSKPMNKPAATPAQLKTEQHFVTPARKLKVCVGVLEGDAPNLKAISAPLVKEDYHIVAIFSIVADTYRLAVATADKSNSAPRILTQFFTHVAGKGGGRDTFAQGGGKISETNFTQLSEKFRQTLQDLEF